jgi:hypothetical protein
MPQHFSRRLVMHRKSTFGEIDDVIGANRSVHIRRRLPPGTPVALEGCDNLHNRRRCRAGRIYHTHENQDNEIPHQVSSPTWSDRQVRASFPSWFLQDQNSGMATKKLS